LVRLHPHLINKSASIVNQPVVIDVTKHADIQELLIVADFVITDYSSLMFDYLFSKKPLLLYVPDLKVYLQQDRELYYNIEELPFLKAYSNPEVTNQIASFEREEYLQGVEEFIHRIGSYEKGDSSKKVLDILNKITNGETI